MEEFIKIFGTITIPNPAKHNDNIVSILETVAYILGTTFCKAKTSSKIIPAYLLESILINGQSFINFKFFEAFL